MPPDSDNNKKTEYADLFKDYSSAWSAGFDEMQADLEMHLGSHFSAKQYAQAAKTGRSLYVFNKTARQVDLIEGYEIRNRNVLKIGPVGKEDDMAASQHTALIMQQMMAGRGYEVLSNCFKWGSLVSGSNLMEIYKDRDGNNLFGRMAHNQFLLDPALTFTDLADCRNILTGKWLHEDTIKMLLPTEADKIDNILSSTASRWREQPHHAQRDYMRLYENRWSMQTGFEDRVLNRMNGQDVTFKEFILNAVRGAGAKAANDLIEAMRAPNGAPMFTKYKASYKRIDLDIFVDSELVWHGPSPLGIDEFPFIWLNGEWCPEMPRSELKLRSFTRKLREPQNARDKRLNQLLDILDTSIQSGKLVRQGALVNEKDAYKAGQGVPVFVNKDFKPPLAEAMVQFGGPQLGGGILEAIEILDREETAAGGMNEEILGDDKKDIPGILAQFRTGQALTGQGGIFQNFRRAKWQLGIKLVKVNQIWLSPTDIQRQLQQEVAQGFYEPDFSRFDCNPIEGLLTASQRQLNFMEMKELYQLFPELIPGSLVVANFPGQKPDELLQAVKQREQQQAQMGQAELQSKQALDQVMLKQAQLDAAKAIGEIADADYDRARTMVEMQKIQDDTRLSMADKMLQYMQIRQQAELAKRQAAGATK